MRDLWDQQSYEMGILGLSSQDPLWSLSRFLSSNRNLYGINRHFWCGPDKISEPKAAEKGSSVAMTESSHASVTRISGTQTPVAGTSGAAVRGA